MTKLTTERLEEMRDHYLGMVNKDVGNALTRILAYEQAADRPVGEIFRCSGNKTLRWWNDVPEGTVLYAAPILPKQPESQQLRDIVLLTANNLIQSGYSPKENSLHPWESLLFEAEKALAAQPVIPAIRKNTASPMLLNFYIAYHSWVKSGARENGIFSRNAGLCVNAYDYFQLVGVSSDSLLEEMHDDFVANGLNEKLPFNDDPEHYEKESKNAACHLNPIRVQWVESKAQPVSEPYKFPQGWMKGQFAYQDLFNAIGAAVVSKHPSIEISVKAFEDSMLAAVPTQDDKSASTELPNHSNLSTNSPVIPDGWKLVPVNATRAMIDAAARVEEDGYDAMHKAMLAAAPAQKSE